MSRSMERRSFHSPDSSSSESIFASPRSSSDLAGHRGCLRVAKRLGGGGGDAYYTSKKTSTARIFHNIGRLKNKGLTQIILL